MAFDDSRFCNRLVRLQDQASVSEKDEAWTLRKVEVLHGLALASARCGEHGIAEDKLLVAIGELQKLDGVSADTKGGAHQVQRACVVDELVCDDPDRPPPMLCAVWKLSACVRVAVHLHERTFGGSKREFATRLCACLPSWSRPTAMTMSYGSARPFCPPHPPPPVLPPSVPPSSPLIPSVAPCLLPFPHFAFLFMTYSPLLFAASCRGVVDPSHRIKMQGVLVDLLKYLAIARRARGDMPGAKEALAKVEALAGSEGREHVEELNRLLASNKISVD